jgi:cell division protein FtsL
MAIYDDDYIYGTAAKKIEYDVYEENKVLKRKKQAKSNYKVQVKTVLCVVAIFAASLVLMYRYAVITDLNYRINDTYKKYNDLRNENSRLSVEIGKDMSLSKVKEVAENRLGMQKPNKYQIVHVRVPKKDVTIVAENYKDYKDVTANTGGALAMVFDKVKKYTQLLY